MEKKLGELVENREKIFQLPHGVDFKHFNNAICNNKIKSRNGLPIAGYFGSLTHANDQEVFIKLARNGFFVVVIGKVLGDYSLCRKEENIFFTGKIDYEYLPGYAKCFDVCLLNWRMADWIKNSFPKKTLEYLAMGKPIVSVKIPELENRFGNLIYFAEDADDFVGQAKKAIAENDMQKVNLRIDSVKNEDWDNRYKFVLDKLEQI